MKCHVVATFIELFKFKPIVHTSRQIMNRLLPILLFLLIVGSADAQQTSWQWVNPLPQGNLINGMWAVNKDTAVAVAEHGTVIRTSNGGTTWQVGQTVGGTIEQILATQFVNASVGWAVGESGRIVKSTDGGFTWSVQTTPTIRDLYALSFVSTTTGWAAGSFGTILATTDGGSTWRAETTGTTNTFYSIYFRTASIGWAVGTAGTILKTSNGGATWIPQTSGTTQTLYSANFNTNSVGWVVGSFGIILKTVNGGATWVSQPSGTTLSLYSMQFTSALSGWAVGSYGTILKSTTGGLTWFSQTSNTYNDLFTVTFASATNGWAMGDLGTIMATTDGGTTWSPQSTGDKNILNGINFSTPTIGYSVGEAGTIIKTTDAGLSWQPQSSGLFQTLYGVYFLPGNNGLTGWAVGDSAIILKTTTGGLSWIESNSRTDPSLYSVYFFTNAVGWTCGDFGTILKSTNGGVSWVPQPTPTFTTLLGMKSYDANIGWAVGYGGTILKTTNGGTTWTAQTSGTIRALYSVDVIDANTAFACGDFGTILKTTNGGVTWVSQVTAQDVSLYSITFFNATTGWAVGDDGAIVGTVDGGNTWIPQQSVTNHTLWSVQSVRGTSGAVIFAAGLGGTIICSAIAPLPTRTWTGAFDSLWTSIGNWNPTGLPTKLDSVYIPSTANNPVIRGVSQQIGFSALRVGSGAQLTIRPGQAQIVVKNGISLDGRLEIDPAATTTFTLGKDFLVGAGGSFEPGGSTVSFTAAGRMQGTFNNLILRESAAMQSVYSITVRNSMIALSNLQLRQVDTLVIQNASPAALQGSGLISSGTIRRAIQPGSTSSYRFESEGTYLKFRPSGTLPDTITITTYPNSRPPQLPDSLFVKRYYDIIPKGGSNYLAFMSLRYDSAETTIPINDLSLFRDSGGVQFNLGRADFLDSDLVAISLDSVRKFSTWYIGRIDYLPVHPLQFTDTLFLSDNGSLKDTLYFGAISGATDGIDVSIGEAALGAVPPGGTFDVRWIIPSTNGSRRDLRDLISATRSQNVYTCRLQAGPGGYPFTVRWNADILPIGTFFLQDQSTHGGQFKINMKMQNSHTITSAAVSQIEIVHLAPTYYNFSGGWNLVSLPLTTTTDGRTIKLFPAAVSNAFRYAGSYIIADTIKNGPSYWLKFPYVQHVPLDGLVRTTDTMNVVEGWNLIGSISTPVLTTSIVKIPSTVVGATIYYGYSSGYSLSDTIVPSKGYWVKATGSGKLVLNASGGPEKIEPGLTSLKESLLELNTIDVSDRDGGRQTLFFGNAVKRDFNADQFDLPPPGPGSFDARFTSGRMAEILSTPSESFIIQLQSQAYPLTLKWNLAQSSVRSFSLRDASNGATLATSDGSSAGALTIVDPATTRIRLHIMSDVEQPRAFALAQNYPNPFNPTTTIAFDLPLQSLVTIKVFNLLGQEVASLADHRQYSAGTYSVTLDASNLSSGVYFYQLVGRGIDSHDFRQVKKMLLMK